MVLPDKFSGVEHAQAIVRHYVNKQIRENFSDLGDEFWDENIGTARGSMRVGCTHKDSDPLQLTLLRLFIFYFIYGQAKALMPDIYGIPNTIFDQIRIYRPQVCLYFSGYESPSDNFHKRPAGEISFRLMDETSETISQTRVNNLATKIKSLFATPKFEWHKGKLLCSYTERERGYQLQLLVRDKLEGKRIVEQVLDIQSHAPDWKFFNSDANEEPLEKYPNNPGTQKILGKTYQKPQRRPVVDVRFRYATLAIHGRPKPINLVDTTHTRSKALERV